MPTFIVIHGVDPAAFAHTADGHNDEARTVSDHVYRFLREELEKDPSGVVTVVNPHIHERLTAAFNGENRPRAVDDGIADDTNAVVDLIRKAWDETDLSQTQFAQVLRGEADLYEEAPEAARSPMRVVS